MTLLEKDLVGLQDETLMTSRCMLWEVQGPGASSLATTGSVHRVAVPSHAMSGTQNGRPHLQDSLPRPG